MWLLRAGADAGDFASFMAHARGLSAAGLDREIRALQVCGVTLFSDHVFLTQQCVLAVTAPLHNTHMHIAHTSHIQAQIRFCSQILAAAEEDKMEAAGMATAHIVTHSVHNTSHI